MLSRGKNMYTQIKTIENSKLLRSKEGNCDQDIWWVGWSSRLVSHTSLGSSKSGIIYLIAHTYF